MSKIQEELAKVSETNPREGESIDSQSYMKRLAIAINEIPEKAWDKLSDDAQEWSNAAAKAVTAKEDIKVYADFKPAASEGRRTRTRVSDEDETPKKSEAKYEPRKGDTVSVVTKRGKKFEGEILNPDDKGELVLKVDGDELGLDLDKIDTIELLKSAAADDPAPRRRRAAEDDDAPAGKNEPEVGDTIAFKTKRGKDVLGVLIEDQPDMIVIRDTVGDEVEYDKSKIDGNVTIKVKGKAESKGGGKAEKDEPKAGKDDGGEKTRSSRSENGGVSVTTRLREIIVDDKTLTLDDVKKKLDKEGLKYNESTAKMVYADCHKMFELLAAGGEIKYKPLKAKA